MTTGLEEIDAILDPAVEVPEELEPELTDLLPKGYLSPSQVTMFLKCPHSWELAYVQGKPRKTVARMFQGVFVHNATEAVLKERLASGKLPPLEMATDEFSTAFDKSKGLIEDWEDETEGAMKDAGIACTKKYYEEAAPAATPIAVEKTLTAVVRAADGRVKLPILGRIDSIQVQTETEQQYQDVREKIVSDENAKVLLPRRIHDLKIVTDKWSEADLENDLQFTIYAGVEHVPDVQVDQVVKGRSKVPRPRYEKLTGVVTPGQVNHVMRVVEDVATSIAMGHFPRTDPGNWWCGPKWCGMWQHCRGKNR